MSYSRHHRNYHSVSFNPVVRCINSIHINEFTDKEVIDSWYTPREYKIIKREIEWTVALMEERSSQVADNLNFTSRGLEDRTFDRQLHKAKHRFFAVAAVLGEQDRQRHQPPSRECNPEALSVVYGEYSYVSQMKAFFVAATDEKVALESRCISTVVHADSACQGMMSTSNPESRLEKDKPFQECIVSPRRPCPAIYKPTSVAA